MKRRTFIQKSSLASTALFVPLFLKSFDGLGNSKEAYNGKKLIIIQLSGGNDGLNTIVPFRNDIYYNNRRLIGITREELVLLNDEVGLNPGIYGFKDLYEKGNLCIINAVGYPNPNRSHFRSMDIWQSASPADQYLSTGWVGRFLDAECKSPHQAIQVGSNLSFALKGKQMNGFAAESSYSRITSEFKQSLTNSRHLHNGKQLSESNLGYLYKTLSETESSMIYLKEKTQISERSTQYPDSSIGKDLKFIADLIIGGADTPVFYASLKGFDSHSNQKKSQEKKLSQYSEAVCALVDDLKKHDHFENTVIFTFSEFGRRVRENASGGTDHGTANVSFIIADKLKKPGLYNPLPNLANLDENGDLVYEIDFRSIYATLLSKHLGVSYLPILGDSFPLLGFI